MILLEEELLVATILIRAIKPIIVWIAIIEILFSWNLSAAISFSSFARF